MLIRFLKEGGGLACYIKSNIKYSDTKFHALNQSCKDLEMLWISIDVNNMRPVIIINIYRPPQGDHKKCNELINDAFERANLKDNTDIFMLGDFIIIPLCSNVLRLLNPYRGCSIHADPGPL